MIKKYCFEISKSEMAQKKQDFFEKIFLGVTGISLRYKDLKYKKNGKPFPVEGWYFSISHSENYLVIAISDRNLGIDIEDIKHSKKMTARMLKRILAPCEQPVNGNYLNNYVIKEAFAKLKGEGLSVGFRKYDANELIKKYPFENLSTDKYIWWILQDSNL